MSTPFISILQLLTAFQCLLFTAFLVIARDRARSGNAALGMMLVLLAMQLLALAAQQAELLAPGATPVSTFGFLYGPLFYFYVRAQIERHAPFRRRTLVHAIPFILSVTAWLIYPLPPNILTVGTLLSVGLYLSACFVRLTRYRQIIAGTRSETHSISLRWLYTATAGWSWVFLLYLGAYTLDFFQPWSRTVYAWTLLFLVLLVFVNAFVFAALRHPRLFSGISPEDEQIVASLSAVRRRTMPTDEDLQVAARIQATMHQDQLYLQPELTLAELAAALNLAPRSVSEVINLYFKQNFAEFINSYRIEAAKRRLLAEETRDESILELLYAVGFNSKSTFNAAFKLKTGLSPSQYRTRGPS